MRKIIYLVLILTTFSLSLNSQIVWDGGGTTNNWSEGANWSGDVTPPVGFGANVVFNGTSTKDCNIDVTVAINDLSILSGYTGTIDGLSSAITLDNDFIQSSGTFISTSNVLEISGDIVFTGGTFTHGGGDVTFYVGTLGNSISGAITFNSLTIQSTAPSGSVERIMDFGTSATTNSLSLVGSTKLFSYLGNINILSNLTISGTNTGNPSSNSGTFTFSGAGPVSISGSASAASNKLPNIVVNTSGNISMSGNVNLRGNWTGTQGTLTAGTSTVNMYGSSASISGAAAAFGNLNIQSGASVALPASEVLIGGTLTRTGTLTFQSATILGLNGTGAQSISGSAITLGGIHAYPGSRTITMSTGVTILDFLQVDDNVTFASGGNVTLAASSSQTARFAELGSGASVTGNVTVETFLPGGATGWANLGVRGVTGQTVADWDTYVSSSGANGIPMTCTLCTYNPSVLSTPFTSIQGWDEPTDGYVELIATDPMNPGVGRWVYVGDGPTTTGDLKLVNTGPLAQGPLTAPVTASGAGDGLGNFSNLVANPYACPISVTSLFQGISTSNQFDFGYAVWVWNANLNGGSGAYTSYINGFSDGQGQTDVIPGGQGFYVNYAPLFSPGVLEFDESMKISTNAPVLKPTNTGQKIKLTLKGVNDENTTGFRIHPDATPFYDRKWDAFKIFTTPGYVGYPGPYSNYTTLSSKDAFGVDYAIQSIPPLTNSVSIPVLAKVSTSGTYTISVSELVDFDNCLILIDRLDNSYHDLSVAPYVFTISDTTSTPRFDLVLCKDEGYSPLGVKENIMGNSIRISQDQQGPYVQTAFAQNTKATISVYNLVGQKLTDDIEVEGTTTNTHLNLNLHNQVVFIRVLSDKETSTKKIVLH